MGKLSLGGVSIVSNYRKNIFGIWAVTGMRGQRVLEKAASTCTGKLLGVGELRPKTASVQGTEPNWVMRSLNTFYGHIIKARER